jgi:hypothetical protein
MIDFKKDLKVFIMYLSPFLILLNPFQIENESEETSLYQKVYKKHKKYCFFKKVKILKKLCL